MKLNSIVKLDKLLSLDGEAIAKVWMARVAGGGKGEAFAMTLPSKTALEIQRTSRRYPSFIVPVNKLTGKEIFYLQSSFNDSTDPAESNNFSINATPLESFKSLGPSAAPISARLSFFMELVPGKGVALVEGKFDGRVLNGTQVSSLVQNILRIWSGDSGSDKGITRDNTLGNTLGSNLGNTLGSNLANSTPSSKLHKWLQCFHERPSEFSFPDYLRDIEQLDR